MDDILFPEGGEIVGAAIERHAGVWAYAVEAVELSHLAYRIQREYAAPRVPGIPSKRRVRNDINDDCWRFFRSIADPLISAGLIDRFVTVDGGDMAILPDGLKMRLKKGTRTGRTSNIRTGNIQRMEQAARAPLLFSTATPLDLAIHEGVVFDVVYASGRVLGEYSHVGLKMASTDASPFLSIDPASGDTLMRISPTAFDAMTDARSKLIG